MERLANKLSMKIATELSYSEEKQEVIEYGLIAVFQTLFTVVVTMIIGYLLGVFIEATVICFAVSILRKYSGGVHATSMISCALVSIITSILLAFAGRELSNLNYSDHVIIFISLTVFLFALITAFIKAPVDSPNKLIKSNKKKLRMKKVTLLILMIYFLIAAGLFLYKDIMVLVLSIHYCLLLSVLWQMGSLTLPGMFLLGKYDRLIYRIISVKGGRNNEKN